MIQMAMQKNHGKKRELHVTEKKEEGGEEKKHCDKVTRKEMGILQKQVGKREIQKMAE
jgi:polyferredoxin